MHVLNEIATGVADVGIIVLAPLIIFFLVSGQRKKDSPK